MNSSCRSDYSAAGAETRYGNLPDEKHTAMSTCICSALDVNSHAFTYPELMVRGRKLPFGIKILVHKVELIKG